MGQAAGYEKYKDLLVERKENGILLVTLNRPEVLNAMTYAMHYEISKIWNHIGDDDKTKVVVVTGAGRAFSAGNDLKQPDPTLKTRFEGASMGPGGKIAFDMLNMEKPIISAINGWAVGAGLQVALLADIAIAANDARLVDGHTQAGVPPGNHAALVWPLLCGIAKAKHHLLTNEPITGEEAERLGLIALAVPSDQVLPKAMEIATNLANGPQWALRWTKRALNAWFRQNSAILQQSLTLEALALFTEDANEVREAFREKRKPVFPSAQ